MAQKEEDKVVKTFFFIYIYCTWHDDTCNSDRTAYDKTVTDRAADSCRGCAGCGCFVFADHLRRFCRNDVVQLISAVLRSLGNSVVPLIFLGISSLLNIVFDILFVAVIPMGVGGAAFATVLAQIIVRRGLPALCMEDFADAADPQR